MAQQLQTAEVTGRVTSVTFPRNGEPTSFRIFCPNIGETFEAVCNLFCPIREGDTIYALCIIDQNRRLHLTRSPFAQPAIDRDSIIQCFMRALRQGYIPVVRLYNNISLMAGGDDNVIPYLTGHAQSWNDTRNTELLFMFQGTEPEDVKKLLFWWHKERNLRRLYLFGLTKKEINACRMTCDEIYNRCMENPYTVPAIPLEKCDAILDRLNKKPDPLNQVRGTIIRAIWKNLTEFGWIGMPTRFLIKNFPGIKDHVEALKKEFGLVADLETAYLKFPHKVEVWVAEYLTNMRKRDKITYDTPLDQEITLEDGSVIQRLSCHYTLDTISEDQMKAVQGAMDHTVCVITGGPGTGKCLAPGTPVLMFDGSIKAIENITQGESVMGPDSKPRKVLSTCTGTDEMFEIIPSKGRPFSCNAPHVLTLKGIEPYIETRKDRAKNMVVNYTIKGIRTRKAFDSRQEAQDFIDKLPEDVFDISLNEFVKRTEYQQRYSYLFHTGIEYPEKEVPIDPYLVGYWLGDGDSAGSRITTADLEIVGTYDRLLKDHNLIARPVGDALYKYGITGGVNNKGHKRSNEFLNVLKDYDMINNKHIPDIYKINSRQNRLKLLAGLIDSDGYQYSNMLEIVQKNVRLADDIEYLAFSLGFMITRVECTKGCMYKGEMRNGTYQRMNIFGDGLDEIPCVLQRKKCEERQSKKRATCLRFAVKSKGQGTYNGFELDGDGRFLLGDFLVTHNTQCISQIVHNLELRGLSYALCSFTGKAVARIREVTKKKNASTIHRLIANTKKNQLDKRSSQFEKDIPLNDYKYAIIDETSMLTEELFFDFLQAYPNIEHLILVGDVSQLSPISWGSLFQQVIKSETIPVYKLTTNFRVYTANGERDGIILNCNLMTQHDSSYPFEFVETSNFSIIEGPMERVFDIIRGCFAGGVKAEQIAILTPYNRCLDALNRGFQSIYNVGARAVTDSRKVTWMINDRVMLLVNDQEIGVFNGETGIIRDITDKAILVDFGSSGCHEFLLEPTTEGRINYNQGAVGSYNYRNKQADQVMDGDEGDMDDERTVKKLQHAFALSIDKSQGSEWDFVIGFIPEFNSGSFLCRNRIFTLCSRTKRCCWVVTSSKADLEEAAVKRPAFRCDNLTRRLQALLPNLKPFKLPPVLKQLEMEGGVDEPIPADMMDNGFDCDDFE